MCLYIGCVWKVAIKMIKLLLSGNFVEHMIPVSDLNVSTRVSNCLVGINIKTVFDLIQKKENDLRNEKDIKGQDLEEIKKALNSLGLKLKS